MQHLGSAVLPSLHCTAEACSSSPVPHTKNGFKCNYRNRLIVYVSDVVSLSTDQMSIMAEEGYQFKFHVM